MTAFPARKERTHSSSSFFCAQDKGKSFSGIYCVAEREDEDKAEIMCSCKTHKMLTLWLHFYLLSHIHTEDIGTRFLGRKSVTNST